MLHNFRLLYVTVAASAVLAACAGDTNENTSSSQSSLESVEIVLAEKVEDRELDELPETEDIEETEDTSEIATETEDTSEDLADEADLTEDTIEPVIQLALEEVIATVGIDKEAHTFIVNQTDDYTEIEVREKKDSGETTLVGKYRFDLEKNKVLVSDYLTGEFIPFEGTAE